MATTLSYKTTTTADKENRLCSFHFKRETRSNTVCDRKRKEHIKKSMLFPDRDSSSAFAVFPGPPRDGEWSIDGGDGEGEADR